MKAKIGTSTLFKKKNYFTLFLKMYFLYINFPAKFFLYPEPVKIGPAPQHRALVISALLNLSDGQMYRYLSDVE